MHCSSLGEFEQGRTVVEQLKILYPNYKILITFFSPSGYEVRKNYPLADYVFYLPMDSAKNAATFFDIVNPSLVIYVKYEFWHYYLAEAKKRKIPLLLLSAAFRKEQPFFQWYGGFHRNMLGSFTHFFVQTKQAEILLQSIGYTNVTVSGDTRFDRVIEMANEAKRNEKVASFCGTHPVVVAGSTWTEDDKELDHFANTKNNVRFIIAPHNIGKDRLQECLRLYKNSVLLSSLSQNTFPEGKNTLIIDNIGILGSLYRYATVCYVGGGFGGDGVHNVLEAAVHGKPVVYGPEFEKYIEAVELQESGGGISVINALDLEKTLDKLLTQDEEYHLKCKASKDYVFGKQGATNSIIAYIQEKRLLTT